MATKLGFADSAAFQGAFKSWAAVRRELTAVSGRDRRCATTPGAPSGSNGLSCMHRLFGELEEAHYCRTPGSPEVFRALSLNTTGIDSRYLVQ